MRTIKNHGKKQQIIVRKRRLFAYHFLLEYGIVTVSYTHLDVYKRQLYDIRDKVGIVFQNPDNQFIGATVADDIAFGLENHQVASEYMQEIIDRYAQKVGMSKYMQSEPTKLSGRCV